MSTLFMRAPRFAMHGGIVRHHAHEGMDWHAWGPGTELYVIPRYSNSSYNLNRCFLTRAGLDTADDDGLRITQVM
ncbi:MAG: hypothetical protein P8Y83_11180, partial [Gammaproteobacteria bacterium]